MCFFPTKKKRSNNFGRAYGLRSRSNRCLSGGKIIFFSPHLHHFLRFVLAAPTRRPVQERRCVCAKSWMRNWTWSQQQQQRIQAACLRRDGADGVRDAMSSTTHIHSLAAHHLLPAAVLSPANKFRPSSPASLSHSLIILINLQTVARNRFPFSFLFMLSAGDECAAVVVSSSRTSDRRDDPSHAHGTDSLTPLRSIPTTC